MPNEPEARPELPGSLYPLVNYRSTISKYIFARIVVYIVQAAYVGA
jgi:hypothetical protein